MLPQLLRQRLEQHDRHRRPKRPDRLCEGDGPRRTSESGRDPLLPRARRAEHARRRDDRPVRRPRRRNDQRAACRDRAGALAVLPPPACDLQVAADPGEGGVDESARDRRGVRARHLGLQGRDTSPASAASAASATSRHTCRSWPSPCCSASRWTMRCSLFLVRRTQEEWLRSEDSETAFFLSFFLTPLPAVHPAGGPAILRDQPRP